MLHVPAHFPPALIPRAAARRATERARTGQREAVARHLEQGWPGETDRSAAHRDCTAAAVASDATGRSTAVALPVENTVRHINDTFRSIGVYSPVPDTSNHGSHEVAPRAVQGRGRGQEGRRERAASHGGGAPANQGPAEHQERGGGGETPHPGLGVVCGRQDAAAAVVQGGARPGEPLLRRGPEGVVVAEGGPARAVLRRRSEGRHHGQGQAGAQGRHRQGARRGGGGRSGRGEGVYQGQQRAADVRQVSADAEAQGRVQVRQGAQLFGRVFEQAIGVRLEGVHARSGPDVVSVGVHV